MSETANYGLYTTDDDTTRFLEWRKKMSGMSNSNMDKIDSILAQKAELSQVINAVLKADGWSGSNAPFTQTLKVENLTADQNGLIDVAYDDITDEQLQIVCDAKIRVSGQTNGSLTISAYGEKPSCNIPVAIILIG